MKPILTINDFVNGIVDDDTLATNSGFSELRGIDIKSELGVAKCASSFPTTLTGIGTVNNFLNWDIDTRVATADQGCLFASEHTNSWNFIKRLTLSAGWTSSAWESYFGTWSNLQPIFWEIALFENRFMYSRGIDKIASVYGWTTWKQNGLSCNSGSTSISLISSWEYSENFNGFMDGGTIYIEDGAWVYNAYGFTFVDATNWTISPAYTWTNGAHKWFLYKANNNWWSVDGTTTTNMNLTTKTSIFRPMVQMGAVFYVWDGSYVATLTSDWVWRPQNLNIGKNYTIKSFEVLNGYLYILADELSTDFNNNPLNSMNYGVRSKVFIWDWDPENPAVNSTPLDCGGVAFAMKAAENRLWLAIKSFDQDDTDGDLIFWYFNGADFMTSKKLKLNKSNSYNASTTLFVYPRGIEYDKNKFYIGINASYTDTTWTTNQSGIWTFTTYWTDKRALSYEFPLNDCSAVQNVKIMSNDSSSTLVTSSASGFLKNTQNRFDGAHLITQRYEITPNQYWQLVRAIDANFKESMPDGSYVDFYYRIDEDTSFTYIGRMDSTNQNKPLFWINRRAKKVTIKCVFKRWTVNTNSPKLIMLRIY